MNPFFGFDDFFSFGGLFVGLGQPTAPIPAGHGFHGAGRYLDAMYAEARRRMLERRRRQMPVLRVTLFQRLAQQGIAKAQLQQKRLIETSMYSVLLAEI